MRHMVNGAFYSVNYSPPASSCTPVEAMTGAHIGLWVFDIRTALIALPPPWGDFEDHVPMNSDSDSPLSRIRLALVARWDDGYLSGPGVGRLYFDPPADPALQPQAAYREALLRQLDQQAGAQAQGQAPLSLPLQQMQQQTLLEYIFQGQAGGPLGVFSSIEKWLPSLYTPIRICAVHAQAPTDQQEQPKSRDGQPPEEIETLVITVGQPDEAGGRLVIQPRRSGNYKLIRLLNAEPALRDDIFLAGDAGSFWSDPDVDLQTDEGTGTAELSDFHWYWDATTGAALARPTAPALATSTQEEMGYEVVEEN